MLADALLLEGNRGTTADNTLREVWIAKRTDGVAGAGTPNDPYDGSTYQKFDALMASFGNYTRINLGPGEYQTHGYAEGAAAWQAKPGMKIIGAGMEATTLKLVGATSSYQYYAVGHDLSASGNWVKADFFEISDLTIDANLAECVNISNVAHGAIRLWGDHCRIRRVKVKNWGGRTGKHCYVISLVTANPSFPAVPAIDPGIEDCVIVDPYLTQGASNPDAATLLHAGLKEEGSNATALYGEGPWIRNCFLDGGALDAYTNAMIGISMGWCLGGLVEGNQIHNLGYGWWAQKTKTFDLVVRNNFHKNVHKGFFLDMSDSSETDLKKLIIEGNTIELHGDTNDTETTVAVAIDLYDFGSSSSKRCEQALVRNNKLRFQEENPQSTFKGRGIRVCGTDALIVENSVVDLFVANPLKNYRCGDVKYFNNATPAGVLIQGYNAVAQTLYGEPATDAEDAILLALFKRR
jgi:hypothetical protein